MEYHPRINLSDERLIQSKIILGSFPTWSLSRSENETINQEKKVTRIKNGDVSYFYGSTNNQFWIWYEKYIDPNVKHLDIKSVKFSLKKNKIGLTDVIYSCKRKEKSALDKHLTQRIYNHDFFVYPKQGEKLKILCTSKGVLNEMLLSNNFFKIHTSLEINIEKSVGFQNRFINKFNGNQNNIKKPCCVLIESETGGVIECVSIPSPGSPYRRLIDFGFDSNNLNDSNLFLDNYLKVIFDWFIE